mgnify:CR=1 FL=1
MRVQAVIFDMDGVLIDSEPLHLESTSRLLRDAFGVEFGKADNLEFLGSTDRRMFEVLRERHSLAPEVEELITGVSSHSIWDLTEAIEREDAAVYLDILKYLFINGVKPSFIIGTLISYYHKIYTAKFLMKHRFTIPDIGKVLQQPSFFLNKFIAQVRNFSDFKIQEVLKLIYRLDYESKTSGEESARISLQNFIFQVKFLK